MDLKSYTGVITALVTPFGKNNEVDYDALNKMLEFQLSNKIKAILVLGTTGESSTLSQEEKDKIVLFTKSVVLGRALVLVGAGSNSTQVAAKLAKHYEKLGVDGLLEITPYYNKANDKGLYKHFEAIANATTLPIIIYNVPSRTGVNISPKVVLELAKIKNIVGLKEATGNLNNVMDILSKNRNFKVFSGDDVLTFPMLSVGAVGVVSVCSNMIPKEMNNLCDSFFEGDFKKAQDIHYENLEIFKKLFYDINPIPLKFYLARMGLIENVLRLPLVEMEEEK